jgi:hypothetical protein
MSPTSHSASQADGKTKMSACGEIHVTLTRGDQAFNLQAVVVKELDVDILAGVPFMRDNGIVLDLPNDSIIIGKKCIPYIANKKHSLSLEVRRSVSFLLKSDKKETIFPGEYIEVASPSNLKNNTPIALEPRSDSESNTWIQPVITKAVEGIIRIPNLSLNPVAVAKHQHLAQVHYTSTASELPVHLHSKTESTKLTMIKHTHSSTISSYPNLQLQLQERKAFARLHDRYDHVFNTQIGQYNDASGHIRAFINMGPVEPPCHKARLPSYNTEKLRLLQTKMDELEDLGVLARPETVGVTIEHVSPSFLVRKPDGSHRLVTAFNAIGTYAKPIQVSLY